MSLMRPDWDPYEHIQYLDMTVIKLCEEMEEMSGQHVNNAWILEEMTKQMVEVSEAINKISDAIVALRLRVKKLESK